MNPLARQFAQSTSRLIGRRRWIFTVLAGVVIFFIGSWWGRSGQVRRITAYIKSYTDLFGHDTSQQIALGIEHRQIKRGGILTNILTLTPGHIRVQPYRALDAGLGLESLVSIAKRHNALAAINGGYFEMSGTFRGESVGALKVSGEWLSEPEQRRAAIGFADDGRAIIDRIALKIELLLSAHHAIEVDGINRGRLENELICYRPAFHPVTLTEPDGVEVIVRRHHVVEIRDEQGSSRIPPEGYVLSANGTKRAWILAHVAVGDTVAIRETVIPERSETQEIWQSTPHILGGGPLLLQDAVPTVSETQESEGFKREFYSWWHPRTAVGVRSDGTLLFVTITAAVPKVRRGVTLSRLAALMRTWGAVDALNLDGGESTMMVIGGEIVTTRLSTKTGEKTAQGNQRIRPSPVSVGRPVADALLVYPNGK